jgi:hypothetical protein
MHSTAGVSFKLSPVSLQLFPIINWKADIFTVLFPGYRYLAGGGEVVLSPYSRGDGDEPFIPQPYNIPDQVTLLNGRLAAVIIRHSADSVLTPFGFFSYTTQIGPIYEAKWTQESVRVIFQTFPDTFRCFTELYSKGYKVAVTTIIYDSMFARCC